MKAEELIVGDIVRVAKNVCIPKGTIVTIRGIDMDNSFEEMNLRGCATCLPINDRYRMTGGVWVEYLEPIPLTPEILEKNGWYHAKFDGSYGRKAMRIDGYYRDELPKGVDNALSFAQWSIDEKFMYHMLEIFMWVGSIHLKIEYVHELQHALRLCGIEKEIEL